jgi:hypothetical protein
MKRSYLLLILLASAAACDAGPKVVVRASLTPDGEPIADLPVQLLPYDRQEVLDSLTRAAEDPEPAPTQELLQRRDSLVAAAPGARQRGDTAVARWNAAQKVLAERFARIERQRAEWKAAIHNAFPEAAAARAAASELSEASDTTDATGRAELAAEEGQWWVYARYVLPDTELEWNVKMTMSGDSVIVPLTRANAKERPLN